MADWTNLPNTAVGVGGVPSGTTVTALRDNPIAIVEGAPGAPRLDGRSFLAGPQDRLAAGNDAFLTRPGQQTAETAQLPGTEILTWRAFPGGVIRVNFELLSDDGEDFSEGRIRVNGSTVDTASTTSTTAVPFSFDISVNYNDVVSLYLRGTSNARMENAAFAVNASGAFPLPFATYAPSLGSFQFGALL